MRKAGKELEFISFVKRDGSGTIPVGTPWTTESKHPKTDDVSYLDDELFEINSLSIGHKTFIASGFNTWVVKLKKKIMKNNSSQGYTIKDILDKIIDRAKKEGIKIELQDERIIFLSLEKQNYMENFKSEDLQNEEKFVITNALANSIIEVRVNGDIFVKGKLMESDKQVVDALREIFK